MAMVRGAGRDEQLRVRDTGYVHLVGRRLVEEDQPEPGLIAHSGSGWCVMDLEHQRRTSWQSFGESGRIDERARSRYVDGKEAIPRCRRAALVQTWVFPRCSLWKQKHQSVVHDLRGR